METNENLGGNENEANQVILIKEKIDFLDNQIHTINAKLNAPKKEKWFKRNGALLISVLALVTSIIFTLYGIQQEKLRNESNKISEIERLTLKLTEISEKHIKLTKDNTFDFNTNGISVLLNVQRQIYVDQIIDLIENVKETFSPEIYSLIGNDLKNRGENEHALKFFRLGQKAALKSKTNEISKVVAFRDLANFYNFHRVHKDSSNYYWEKSIEQADSISGGMLYLTKGYSFQLWAGQEMVSGNTEFSFQLIDSARVQYLKLPENNLARQSNLNLLRQMIENENRKELTKVFFDLNGEWNSSKNNRNNTKIYFLKNLNGWFCNIEVYELGKIEYSLAGQLVSTSEDSMTFFLQGVKGMYGNPYSDLKQTSATMKVHGMVNEKDTMLVSFNELKNYRKKFKIFKKY